MTSVLLDCGGGCFEKRSPCPVTCRFSVAFRFPVVRIMQSQIKEFAAGRVVNKVGEVLRYAGFPVRKENTK